MLMLLATLFSMSAHAVRIVTTLPDLAAVASEVGGEDVKITAMALPSQDPHFVDARPNLALELSRADLLLLIGLEMEVGWLPTLLTGSRNKKIQKGAAGYLDCSQFVNIQQIPTMAVDRSMGDVHPGGNPHYFYDPRAMVAVARGIANRLAELDPTNAEAYQRRSATFVAHLDSRRAHWEQRLAPLQNQPVIGYHRSWPYLEDWLGFEIVSDVEPRPGIPPSPSSIAKVVGIAKQRGVKLVLIESFYPSTTAQLVAEKSGANLVSLHGGADFAGGERYSEHIEEWVNALAQGAVIP